MNSYTVLFDKFGNVIDTLEKIGGVSNFQGANTPNLLTSFSALSSNSQQGKLLFYNKRWEDTTVILNEGLFLADLQYNLFSQAYFINDSILIYSDEFMGVFSCNVNTRVWTTLIPECMSLSRSYRFWFMDPLTNRLVFEKRIRRRVSPHNRNTKLWITFVSTDLNGQDEQPFLMPDQQ